MEGTTQIFLRIACCRQHSWLRTSSCCPVPPEVKLCWAAPAKWWAWRGYWILAIPTWWGSSIRRLLFGSAWLRLSELCCSLRLPTGSFPSLLSQVLDQQCDLMACQASFCSLSLYSSQAFPQWVFCTSNSMLALLLRGPIHNYVLSFAQHYVWHLSTVLCVAVNCSLLLYKSITIYVSILMLLDIWRVFSWGLLC